MTADPYRLHPWGRWTPPGRPWAVWYDVRIDGRPDVRIWTFCGRPVAVRLAPDGPTYALARTIGPEPTREAADALALRVSELRPVDAERFAEILSTLTPPEDACHE